MTSNQELIDLLAPLIEWRNFLAHRYLRVRLVHGKDQIVGTLKMAAELIRLAQAFAAASQRMTSEHLAIMSRWPKQDAPAGVSDMLSSLARCIITIEPAELRDPGDRDQGGA